MLINITLYTAKIISGTGIYHWQIKNVQKDRYDVSPLYLQYLAQNLLVTQRVLNIFLCVSGVKRYVQKVWGAEFLSESLRSYLCKRNEEVQNILPLLSYFYHQTMSMSVFENPLSCATKVRDYSFFLDDSTKQGPCFTGLSIPRAWHILGTYSTQ